MEVITNIFRAMAYRKSRIAIAAVLLVVIAIGVWWKHHRYTGKEVQVVKGQTEVTGSVLQGRSTKRVRSDEGQSGTKRTKRYSWEEIATLSGADPVSKDVAEAYLRRKGRTPETLLAAAFSTGDDAFLREAAESFADSPEVQFAVLAREDLFPDERSLWVDRLKASQPDNALASYYAASESLLQGNVDLASAELRLGAQQTTFDDLARQRTRQVEELFAEAGARPIAAGSRAVFSLYSLPRAQIRELADSLRELHAAEGDSERAAEIAALGAALGNHLSQGGGSHLLTNQSLGMHLERTFLGQMDPEDRSLYSGRSVGEALADLEAQQNAMRGIGSGWAKPLSEEDASGYYRRVLEVGELEANRWLQEVSSEAVQSVQ